MPKEPSYEFGDAPVELQKLIKGNHFISRVLDDTEATGVRLEALPDGWIDPSVGQHVYKAYRLFFVGLSGTHALNSHNATVYAQTKEGQRWHITTPVQRLTGR